ncbi:MAG: 16S rRNA processing protein RimM [Solirubrobacterales bacterium]|nr:16S rRNA processing protein RimM [Solirubrobacterales bacterium]MBV9367040.1 16S rRNA processing protein RimM [Solirubrobacterales bacterium]MBV9808422.1 16S rRNA processing protein RimM [Solirubrobacterales bacterium]
MQWLHAGRVGRPHGLDGSFHVTRPNLELLENAASVMVDDRELEITRRAGTPRRLILRLQDHENRAAAEALRGKDMLVARSEAPELGPDEWWAEELVGCAVHDGARVVGTVRRLVELPSCEMLEVERTGGGELLVPLVSDAVREVDVDARAIDVDLRFLGEA